MLCQRTYLLSAVNMLDGTIDVIFTAERDAAAAWRFFAGTNAAAIKYKYVCDDACIDVELRQYKYLSNIVEHAHRAVERIVRPTLRFKSFWSARTSIAGVETTRMIK